MGWERDCATSVRDLIRVLNKAGGAGVSVMAKPEKCKDHRRDGQSNRTNNAFRR